MKMEYGVSNEEIFVAPNKVRAGVKNFDINFNRTIGRDL